MHRLGRQVPTGALASLTYNYFSASVAFDFFAKTK